MEDDGLLDLIEVPDMETPAELVDKLKPQEDNSPLELVDTEEELKEKLAQKPEKKEEEPEKKKYELNDDEYSRAVQRRVAKEVAKRKSLEEELAATRAQNDLLREKYEKQSTESFETRQKEITEKRTAAVEAGDLDASIQLSDELFALKLDRQKSVIEEPKYTQKAENNDEDDIHPSAQAWLDRNLWYYDGNSAEKARKAEEIQNELLVGGMTFSDELYSEVDKRLKAQTRSEDIDPAPAPAGKPTPAKPGHLAAPSSGGDDNPKPKPNEFTDRDKSVMRQFKLDPDDPKARAAYMKRRSQR